MYHNEEVIWLRIDIISNWCVLLCLPPWFGNTCGSRNTSVFRGNHNYCWFFISKKTLASGYAKNTSRSLRMFCCKFRVYDLTCHQYASKYIYTCMLRTWDSHEYDKNYFKCTSYNTVIHLVLIIPHSAVFPRYILLSASYTYPDTYIYSICIAKLTKLNYCLLREVWPTFESCLSGMKNRRRKNSTLCSITLIMLIIGICSSV